MRAPVEQAAGGFFSDFAHQAPVIQRHRRVHQASAVGVPCPAAGRQEDVRSTLDIEKRLVVVFFVFAVKPRYRIVLAPLLE